MLMVGGGTCDVVYTCTAFLGFCANGVICIDNYLFTMPKAEPFLHSADNKLMGDLTCLTCLIPPAILPPSLLSVYSVSLLAHKCVYLSLSL